MTQTIESLKPLLEKLIALRDAEGNGLTQQAIADKLNAEGVLSLTGAAWSKYSVRRILKKMNLQTVISATQFDVPEPQPAARRKQEGALRADAPLRQWSYFESIRNAIEKLTSKPYTPKDLAAKLNKQQVPTLDGKSWTTDSVTRALKVLSPDATRSIPDDDEIRENIRRGLYDTDTEQFVSVRITAKNSKSATKPKKSKDKDKKGKKNKK
jgi:hypothetical protein